MLFLHTGDLNRTVQHEILSLCNNVHARMQLLTLMTSGTAANTAAVKVEASGHLTAGYRHMIASSQAAYGVSSRVRATASSCEWTRTVSSVERSI